ncbi:uncharacterized protein LOC114424112 [Glycine soja]|uniref:uncharacterized protein LOC114424112 n=1 Tax=Glycine soja TaxID=3848 RepID=UPI00103B93E9|nr:uncharacterized protein LOC114424112 [Glycine soja]
MDSKLVGKNILAMVEENEQLTILTFIVFIRQEFGYTITYRKAWLAKQWALKIQTIPALDESNQPIPDKVIFHRIFWSFKACIDAFAFCKLVMKIDGTWLYGRYKGTLLIAVAQDGTNNIFPLAFDIVKGETTYG